MHTLDPKSHLYLYVIQKVTYSISLAVSYWCMGYRGCLGKVCNVMGITPDSLDLFSLFDLLDSD